MEKNKKQNTTQNMYLQHQKQLVQSIPCTNIHSVVWKD